MTSGGRQGWWHHMERVSRLGSYQARKGTVALHLPQFGAKMRKCQSRLMWPPSFIASQLSLPRNRSLELSPSSFQSGEERACQVKNSEVPRQDRHDWVQQGKCWEPAALLGATETVFRAAAGLPGRWPTSPLSVGTRPAPAHWSNHKKKCSYYCTAALWRWEASNLLSSWTQWQRQFCQI